jgi:hypothetical protein
MGRPREPNSIFHDGSDYTPAQIEFMRAMSEWKRYWRREPDCRDVLKVARKLGYQLTARDRMTRALPSGGSGPP